MEIFTVNNKSKRKAQNKQLQQQEKKQTYSWEHLWRQYEGDPRPYKVSAIHRGRVQCTQNLAMHLNFQFQAESKKAHF